jgi:hypothetical protein
MKRNPYFNQEGYPDPTAYYGLKVIVKEEELMNKQVHDLCHIIKDICHLAGYDVMERIQLKHMKTGKEFK